MKFLNYIIVIALISCTCSCANEMKETEIIVKFKKVSLEKHSDSDDGYYLFGYNLIGENSFETKVEQELYFKRLKIDKGSYLFPSTNLWSSSAVGTKVAGYMMPLEIDYFVAKDKVHFNIEYEAAITGDKHFLLNTGNSSLYDFSEVNSMMDFIRDDKIFTDTLSKVGLGYDRISGEKEFIIKEHLKGVIDEDVLIVEKYTDFENLELDKLKEILPKGKYEFIIPENFIDTIYLK